jgi:hypothetical protein
MQVLTYVDTPSQLVRALAERRYELGIRQLDIDAIAGIADGLTGKLECGSKRLGDTTLPALLGALGLRLALVEAEEGLPTSTRRLVGSSRGQPAGPRHRAAEEPLEQAAAA